MRLIKFEQNSAKIAIENLDDLWYLNGLVDEGDIVRGKTFRKIKLGEVSDRNQKIIKKPVFLKIKVLKVEFHPYSNVLRISGKVNDGIEDVPSGSHHTFNVEEGSELTLEKPEWLRFQKSKLKEATEGKSPDILVVVMDRDEAHFALLKRSGYEFLSKVSGDVAKKAESSANVSDFYADCRKVLEEYTKRYSIKKIVIGSPAFWKDELFKKLGDDLKKKVILATISSGDKSAINELLKRDEVKSALTDVRMAEELKLVEKLLGEISKDGASVYGIDETKKAVDLGAALVLLVTDSLIRNLREKGEFSKLDRIMKTADRMGAEVHIISSEHDGGKKLDGIGGVGAVLRYNLNY